MTSEVSIGMSLEMQTLLSESLEIIKGTALLCYGSLLINVGYDCKFGLLSINAGVTVRIYLSSVFYYFQFPIMA